MNKINKPARQHASKTACQLTSKKTKNLTGKTVCQQDSKPVKASKILNPNNKKAPVTTELTWHERYKRMCQWNEQPLSDAFIDLLSVEIMQWADQNDSLRIVDFCHTRGFIRETLIKWAKTYPSFGKAYKYALEAIGSRRENGVLLEGWNPSTIHFTQGHYCDVWKAQEDKIFEQKKTISNENPESKTIIVCCEKAQDCPEVKPLVNIIENNERRDKDKA